MKRILVILFILGLVHSSYASISNDSIISTAVKQYNDGLYQDAIKSYDLVLESGFESAEIYYNKGNSYFKLNDLPSAILFYEKARKLKPNDKDIQFNLNVANSRIIDNIESVPEIFLKTWWNNFYNMFSANGWTKITIGLFIIFLLFVSIYILSSNRFIKKLFFGIGVIFFLSTLFSFALSYQKYYYSIEQKEAIVFQATVTIKSSPNKNSVDLFVIHEGTKVYISDELDGWYEIKIANGSVGWLPKSSTKLI
jgi:tetratricopeptide (TPR) repeat protein